MIRSQVSPGNQLTRGTSVSDPPRSSPQGLGSPQELSTNLCGEMLVGCGPSSGNWVSLKMMLSASQKQAQVVGNLGQRRTISELAMWEAVPGPRSVAPLKRGPLRCCDSFSGEPVFVLRDSPGAARRRVIRALGGSRVPWGLPGGRGRSRQGSCCMR